MTQPSLFDDLLFHQLTWPARRPAEPPPAPVPVAPALVLSEECLLLSPVDVGSAVRISPRGGLRWANMTQEGVVIEVALAGKAISARRASYAGTTATSRSLDEPRYIVQTDIGLLVRRAVEMLVVAP